MDGFWWNRYWYGPAVGALGVCMLIWIDFIRGKASGSTKALVPSLNKHRSPLGLFVIGLFGVNTILATIVDRGGMWPMALLLISLASMPEKNDGEKEVEGVAA